MVRQLQAVLNAAKAPKIVSLSGQSTSWRGEPWEAFVGIEGEIPTTCQWFSGFSGDTSKPVADGNKTTLRIADLKTSERYWVRASNKYGNVNSKNIVVEVRTLDKADHRAEIDELMSFARTLLEQLDNLREIDATQNSLVPLSDAEQHRFADLRFRSQTKMQEAASHLVTKLIRLKTQANIALLNDLFSKSRPAVMPLDSLEGSRQRKSFDLIENLWHRVREQGPVNETIAIDIAKTKLPL